MLEHPDAQPGLHKTMSHEKLSSLLHRKVRAAASFARCVQWWHLSHLAPRFSALTQAKQRKVIIEGGYVSLAQA